MLHPGGTTKDDLNLPSFVLNGDATEDDKKLVEDDVAGEVSLPNPGGTTKDDFNLVTGEVSLMDPDGTTMNDLKMPLIVQTGDATVQQWWQQLQDDYSNKKKTEKEVKREMKAAVRLAQLTAEALREADNNH